jgi:hypothetical protein
MQVSTHRQIARPSSLFAVRFRLEILLASRRQGPAENAWMHEHGRRSLQARSNAPIVHRAAESWYGPAAGLVEQANVQLLFRHALVG